MNKVFTGRIYADYYQFYLFDGNEYYAEDMPGWDEENVSKGYISNGRIIYLGTRAHFHNHWLDVYLSDQTPSFDECERALSLNLKITSGKLGIASPLDTIADIDIKEGSYIAYILAFNLTKEDENELSDEELEQRTDLERYTIVLVPGSTDHEGVIKGQQYLD